MLGDHNFDLRHIEKRVKSIEIAFARHTKYTIDPMYSERLYKDLPSTPWNRSINVTISAR